jgi:hypothetical protein
MSSGLSSASWCRVRGSTPIGSVFRHFVAAESHRVLFIRACERSPGLRQPVNRTSDEFLESDRRRIRTHSAASPAPPSLVRHREPSRLAGRTDRRADQLAKQQLAIGMLSSACSGSHPTFLEAVGWRLWLGDCVFFGRTWILSRLRCETTEKSILNLVTSCVRSAAVFDVVKRRRPSLKTN